MSGPVTPHCPLLSDNQFSLIITEAQSLLATQGCKPTTSFLTVTIRYTHVTDLAPVNQIRQGSACVYVHVSPYMSLCVYWYTEGGMVCVSICVCGCLCVH